jgi:hypothetical protein
MKKADSYIMDSTHLQLLVQSKQLPPTIVLTAADITTLYPSIDIDDSIITVRNHLNRHPELLPPITNLPTPFGHSRTPEDSIRDINFVMDLITFVLKNNYVSFSNLNALQIKGVAMGISFAPTFSSIYIAELELETLEELKTEHNLTPEDIYFLHKRFIDDLFTIFKSLFLKTLFYQVFNNRRPSITCEEANIQCSSTTPNKNVDFMDVTFYLGPLFLSTGYLDSALYIKPINSFAHLPPSSYHDPVMFDNVVNNDLLRRRLRYTDHTAFLTDLTTNSENLIARGFFPSRVKTLSSNATTLCRATIFVERCRTYNLPPPRRFLSLLTLPLPQPPLKRKNCSLHFTTLNSPLVYPNTIQSLHPPPSLYLHPDPNIRNYFRQRPTPTTIASPAYTELNGPKPTTYKRNPPNLGKTLFTYHYPTHIDLSTLTIRPNPYALVRSSETL